MNGGVSVEESVKCAGCKHGVVVVSYTEILEMNRTGGKPYCDDCLEELDMKMDEDVEWWEEQEVW